MSPAPAPTPAAAPAPVAAPSPAPVATIVAQPTAPAAQPGVAPSKFFPMPGAAPAAPAAPVAQPGVAPVVPAAPSLTIPDPRAAFFNPQPVAPAQGPTAPAQPAQPAAPGAAAPEFDPEKFASDYIRQLLPDDFLKPDHPEAKNFGAIRDALAKSQAEALKTRMELVRAHKSGPVADQAALDRLKAAEAQITEWKPRLEKLTALEARAELLDNEAFGTEYAAKLDGLKAEAKAIATEAKIDVAIVEKALSAESKLGAAKALAEVTDPDAKSLLLDIARQALDTTSKFKAEWKDPVKALEGWRAKAAERGTARSTQNASEAIALHRQAVQSAIAGDPARGVPGNFALAAMLGTEQGQASIAAIEAQYAGNQPIQPGEVIAARVQAATVPHLVAYTTHLEQQLQAAMQRLATYGSLEPGGYAQPGQQAQPQQAGQSRFWSFNQPTHGPVVQVQAAQPGGFGAPIVAQRA